MMAIPEACGLWIEQRVQEELDQRGETGASLREISRLVAAEVEKYFETKVKPGTIFQKARRIDADTNVSPKSSSVTIENNEDSKSKEANETQESSHGGTRKGAGRKYSQTTRWKKVINDLAALIEYMSAHCEAGAKIPVEMQADFDNHVGTLNLYNDDF